MLKLPYQTKTHLNRYVEKADFVAIVAPGCLHANRRQSDTKLRTKTCYRTYRNRGWCVLEIFASFMSRYKQYPILCITSKEGIPEWVSPLEIHNLAVGTSDFTCCQRNHIFGHRVVPCDRGITRAILENMIKAKAVHLFKLEQTLRARLCVCYTNWWLRTESTPAESCSGSLALFQKLLRWDKKNDDWKDQNGVSMLIYAVICNDSNIVRSLLNSKNCTSKSLNTPTFVQGGIVEFGIAAKTPILNFAMYFGSAQVVEMLLNCGACPDVSDQNGMDPMMFACVPGRVENIKYWLARFPRWNVNRGNMVNGATALHCSVYFGCNKLKTVRVLVETGRASLNVLNHGGASVLSNAVDSTDSNIDVVRYLLTKSLRYGVNHRRKARTVKWKLIYGLARGLFRSGVATSGLFAELACDSGSTPLQYAVCRGDLEIVELMMMHGADPFIKNDLGRGAVSYCEAFPEIKYAIERVKRENKRVQQNDDDKKSSISSLKSGLISNVKSHAQSAAPTTDMSSSGFTLQRRLSTATDIKYDMYLISLSTMVNLFGTSSHRKKNSHLCHQDLLEEGKLTRFEDLPMGSFVMFVSHQWTSFDHPDPNGVHMSCMLSIFCQLRDGKYDVEVDPFHTILYKEKCRTSKKEFTQLLSNAYVWYDFWSQPQPTMTKSPEKADILKKDLFRAIESMGAYVERADCLVIVTPGTVHSDRIDSRSGRKKYVCFRTFRRRGLCVLEMFAAMCSRRKTHPILLLQSSKTAPKWLSPLEAQNLAVGESEFTCCERNHENNMSCSRNAVKDVMIRLVDKRVACLYEADKTVVLGRMWFVQKQWFLRGLTSESLKLKVCKDIEGFKKTLLWNDNHDGEWFDRGGISLLLYGIGWNNASLVRLLLNSIKRVTDQTERHRRLLSVAPKSGFPQVGITSRMNSLCVAMFMAGPEIVEMLLHSGIDPTNCTDGNGIDPFMFACVTAKIDNLRCWLQLVKSWNVNRRNAVNGATALHTAVYVGASKHKLELVRFLVEKCGARVDMVNDAGSTVLSGVVENEDVDSQVLDFILSQGVDVNQKRRSRTTKWHLIRFVAKMTTRGKGGGLMPLLAIGSGATALHHAVIRGDIEIVEKLLTAGADPSLKNDLGQDAAAMCTSFPELRGVLEKRERKMKLRGKAKKTKTVEVLGKRISTATPIQHTMWLISLETLLMLYVYSCLVDFSLTLIYLTHHTHTGTEKEARVVLWKSIRS